MFSARYVDVPINRYTRLLHPKLVTLIVTKSGDGRVNVMPASWAMPTSVDPPLLTVAVSPRRYTYELLQARGEFTVNPVPVGMKSVVDFTGSVSGREVDKARSAGIGLFDAKELSVPCVEGALSCIECSVWAQYPAGDHVLVVGRVRVARVLEDVWDGTTYILDRAKPLLHLGGDKYSTSESEI
ncbi:flavin reductase family protein [Infirmifilum lucidum]|uniref:Flavin reductase family protein n=1 Tax=Infirmifilum lucidum TaxID=2776706 RepID=A0A7L9FHC0_9CREN|nr:flavin reductase family protein [Infirmifilum lucidum]QOJ79200.1 flavin reductase family protein [Infirmifilum lucidum]